MKRKIYDGIDSDSDDSDFVPTSGDNESSFSLRTRSPMPRPGWNRTRYPEDERLYSNVLQTSRPVRPVRPENDDQSPYLNVLQAIRPVWPANDQVTPEISLGKITELQSGSDDEKLMAAFARHVIKPGSYNCKSRWVSRGSLERLFPEHFNKGGFVLGSTWRNRAASDFGLPRLFFRGIDQERALLLPGESIEYMTKDLGYGPSVKGLTKDEYVCLQKRDSHDAKDSPIIAKQPSLHATRRTTPKMRKPGVDIDIGVVAKEDSKNNSHSADYIDSRPSKEPRPPVRNNTPTPTYPEVTPSRDLTASVKLEATENVRSEHETPSHGLGLSTPRTTTTKSDHSHIVLQQGSVPDQQERPTTINEPAEFTRAHAAVNDRRIVTKILGPRIYDILKDFPTAPDDQSFRPLLRRLVKATMANLSRDMEETHLDLTTHVIVHCASDSPTDQVEAQDLVRPVMRILFRNRQRTSADVFSNLQRQVNSAARASNLIELRFMHARLLIFEAHHEESQVEQ